MQRVFPRASYLNKLFGVLLVLVLLPVIVTTSVSNAVVLDNYNQEVARSSIERLQVADRMGEFFVRNLEESCLRLASDSELSDLVSQGNSYSAIMSRPKLQYALLTYLQKLSETVASNRLIHSIDIYLADADYVISTRFGVRSRQETERDFGFAPLGAIESEDRASVISVPFAKSNPNRLLCYRYPITSFLANFRGTLVINLYEDSFCLQINSDREPEDSSVSLWLADGTLLAAPRTTSFFADGHLRPLVRTFLDDPASSGFQDVADGGTSRVLTWFKNERQGWIYVGTFSTSALEGNLTRLRTLMVLLGVVLASAGLIATFLVSQRLFSPVRRLVSDVKARMGSELEDSENELKLLSSAYTTFLKREDQLFFALEKRTHQARQELLRRSIEGELSGEEEQELHEVLGKGFERVSYRCLVFILDHRMESTRGEEKYVLGILESLAETMYSKVFPAAAYLSSEDRICLVVCEPEEDFRDSIENLLNQFQVEVRRLVDASVSLGVGVAVDGLSRLRPSYLSALAALQARFLAGPQLAHWPGEHDVFEAVAYPDRLESRLLDALEVLNPALVHSCIGEFSDYIGSHCTTYTSALLVLNQLCAGLLRFIFEHRLDPLDVFGQEQPFATLNRIETLELAHAWLGECATRIIAAAQRFKSGDENSHAGRIRNFIDQNYKRGFDIAMISDALGLSYSYVRRVFEDAYGESILAYVNRRRIEEAKKLLAQTALQANEIARSLGYSNDQSFNRYFKKYTGSTAGAFRHASLTHNQAKTLG